MLVIGVDVGINGALAALNRDGKALACVMPIIKGSKGVKPEDGSRARRGTPSSIDGDAVRDWIRGVIDLTETEPDQVVVCIETQQAMPKQGLVSTFHLGESFGILQGIVKGMRLSMLKVKPKVWKKAILPDTPMDKSAAIAYVRNRFPTVDLNVGKRKEIMHDGMADAICIAAYAVRISDPRAPALAVPVTAPAVAGESV